MLPTKESLQRHLAAGGAGLRLGAAGAWLVRWGVWEPVTGRVDGALVQQARTGRGLDLVVEYSYAVGGRWYQGSGLLTGDASPHMQPVRELREKLLAGAALTVYVDPRAPMRSRLFEPTFHGPLFLALPGILMLVAAGFMPAAPWFLGRLAEFAARGRERRRDDEPARTAAPVERPAEPNGMVIHLLPSPYLGGRGQCLARANVLLGGTNDDDVRFEIVPRAAAPHESLGAEQGDTMTTGHRDFDELFVLRTNAAGDIDRLLTPLFRRRVQDLYDLRGTAHGAVSLNRFCLTLRKALPVTGVDDVDELTGCARDIVHAVFAFLGVPTLLRNVQVVRPPGGLDGGSSFVDGKDGATSSSTPELDELVARELPDHYRDVRTVGRGGMGAVFAARDSRTDQAVAIKILDPRFAGHEAVVRRFYRETVATSNLRHPNIPRIMDVKRGRLPFYVMEFVDGSSLDALLRSRGSLPPPQVVAVALGVAQALAAAHEAGIVHRDMKPSNVIVTDDGQVKVVDFGIAHFDEDSSITSSGQALGTPQYMAPEQVQGLDVTPATDVYSLGVVMFELLAGSLPFAAHAPYARVFQPPPPLLERKPDCPPALAELVMRCLSRHEDERFANGAALVAALAELAGADGAAAAAGILDDEDDTTVNRHAEMPAPVYVSDANLKSQLEALLPDRYRSLSLLGRGGMGAVFAAMDEQLGKPVAVKVLDPRYRRCETVVRRFYRETVTAANLRHPNVPRIMDVKRGDLPYFVMEYVAGTPLDELLKRHGPLPAQRAVTVARQVAAALSAAHEAGVIHRDVKPSNILVGDDDATKVVDFGLAWFAEGTALTQTGQPLGTPKYMSPEQIQGMHAGPSSDVYSTGLTLYEMLAGTSPFDGGPPFERVFQDPRPLTDALPDVDRALAALVMRCIERAPDARYADGGALEAALAALDGSGLAQDPQPDE